MLSCLQLTAITCLCLAQDAAPVERRYDLRPITARADYGSVTAEGLPSTGDILIPAWEGLCGPQPTGAGIYQQKLDPSLYPSLIVMSSEDPALGAGVPGELIEELIRETLAPGTWDDPGRSLLRAADSLSVIHTPEMQAQVANFLAWLEARRARRLTIDVAVVPVVALPPGATTSLPREALEAALERAGDRGERVTLVGGESEWLDAFAGKRVPRPVGDEVNQTGIVPVTNILVASVPLGLSVGARVSPVAHLPQLRVDLRVARLSESRAARLRATPLSTFELLTLSEDSLETTTLVTPGRTVVVASVRSREPEIRDFAVLLRVSTPELPAWTPAPRAGDERELRLHDLAFLVELLPGETTADGEPVARGTPAQEAEEIRRLLEANVDPEVWEDGGSKLTLGGSSRWLLVVAPRPTQEKVQAYLDSLLAPLARTGSLDLTILDGPLDALLELESEADTGARLPEGTSSGGRLLETSRCRVSCAVGSRALVRSLESEGFVSGVIVLAGGACYAVPPSPNASVATAGSGLEVEVRLERTLAGGGIRTRLRAEACRRTADRSASTVDLAERAPGSGAAGQRIGPAWLPFDIDLPRQERMRVSSSTSLLARRPELLAIDDAGEGFGRAAVASLDVERWLDRPALARPPPVLPIAGVDPPGYLTQRLHLPPPLLRQQNDYYGEWEPQEAERGQLATLATPADIAEIVERFVGQGTWEPGSTVLRGASLLVLKPPAAQAVVASFLRSLAAREERRVFVELLLASPEAVRAVAPDALRPGASPWLPAEALRTIARAAPAGSTLRAASGRAGELLLLPPQAVSSWLDDYEVLQSGVTPATQPVVHGHPEGSYVEAQALPGPGDAWCRLDLRWGCVRPEGAPLRRRAIYGDIDLPGRSHEEVSATVAIPWDATAVLGFLEFPGEGGLGGQDPGPRSYIALARVRCAARDAAAAEGDGPFLIDVGALLAEPPWGHGDRWRGPFVSFDREGGPAPPALTADELRERLGRAMGGDLLERIEVQGRFVVGRGSAAEADHVRTALDGLARDRLRQITLDICALPSTPELLAATAPDGTLRDGPWRHGIESARSSRIRMMGVHGMPLRIAGVRGRSYLAKINPITGGSGAVLGHLYDPTTAFAGGGAVLEATPDLTSGAARVDVWLRLELAPQPIFGRTVRTPTPVAFTPIPTGASTAAAPAVPAAPSPPAAAPDPTVELELPEDLGSRHQQRARVPSGQPTLLSVEPDSAAPGKARALILWAREASLP